MTKNKNKQKGQKENIKRLRGYSVKNRMRDVYGENIFRKALYGHGIHYQRQKVLLKYIVDFYLPKRNLIVEIDGKYHQKCQEYDEMRQAWLQRWGYVVLRFTDQQVTDDINFCIEQVLAEPETKQKYKNSKYKVSKLNGNNGFKYLRHPIRKNYFHYLKD